MDTLRKPKGICFILILFCFVLFIFQQMPIRNEVFQSERKAALKRLQQDETCVPAKNVAYAKVHKTGSSAIQGLLFRYGLSHNLTFALPEDNHFNQKIPFDLSMVYPKGLFGRFEFNIFAIHCMWNHQQIKALMPSDSAFIASVREPMSQFVSMFEYASFEERTGISLDNLLYLRGSNTTKLKNVGYAVYNQMGHDFGLAKDLMDDKTAVQLMIGELDRTFDLVLLTERMDESLILLRHLLCWDLKDVVVFKVNQRGKNKITKISEKTQTLLKRRLQADFMIYEHFKRKFERLVEEFGRERMDKERQQLVREKDLIRETCRITTEHAETLKEFKGSTSEACKFFVYTEPQFKSIAKEKQKTTLQQLGLPFQ